MRKSLLLALFFALGAGCAYSQTAEEKSLETAVRQYNQLHSMTGKLSAATITDGDLQYVVEQVESGLSQLALPGQSADPALSETARYFQSVFQYEKVAMLDLKGRVPEALTACRQAETGINSFTRERFPVRYRYEGQLYEINWADFAPLQAQFNATFCTLLYQQKDYTAALPYARKANANEYLSMQAKARNNRMLLQMKIALGEQDREQRDAALDALEAYTDLSEEERSGLAALPGESAAAIQGILEAQPGLAEGGAVWARASRLLEKAKQKEAALGFAASALKAGYRNRNFAQETAGMAIAARDVQTTGLALDQLAALTPADDCEGLATLARLYLQAGDKARGQAFDKKTEDCRRHQRRLERAANREGGLYVGAYVLPLFRTDWGLVGAIQTRRLLIEGSYQAISDRRDRLLDQQLKGVSGASDERVRWDGYYSHLAISGISRQGRPGARPYMGALFGYNLRKFDLVRSQVFDEQNNYLGEAEFRPRENRYILLYNTGFHTNRRLLAADVYFSLGGSYNLFERGNPDYETGSFTFTNILLRRKEARFSVMARIGLTIGLQFGPKTIK